jgi:hypothetical protein
LGANDQIGALRIAAHFYDRSADTVVFKRGYIVGELATKPGHDKVKAAIQDLLVDGLVAERNHVRFEQRVPEAQGRIDAILGRTAFEVKSELQRELGDAEAQLARYLPERENATKSRFVGIATDGLDWRAYEWRDGNLGPVDIHRSQIMAPTRNSMDANESAVFS